MRAMPFVEHRSPHEIGRMIIWIHRLAELRSAEPKKIEGKASDQERSGGEEMKQGDVEHDMN
jgi:hypothetical protein